MGHGRRGGIVDKKAIRNGPLREREDDTKVVGLLSNSRPPYSSKSASECGALHVGEL